MEGVIVSSTSEIIPLERNSVDMYSEIINTQENVFENSLRNDMSYEIEEQDLAMNTVILASNETGLLEKDNEAVVKIENINFKTTDDESMAVEALRQLGGMYNSVQQDLILSCNLCDQEFNTASDLHAHNAICKVEFNSTLTCSNCQEVFDNKSEFGSHTCYLQDMFQCKFCNQNFFGKSDLEAHVNTLHQTERPYKCVICNLTFPRNSSLKNHLKIHTYVPGRALFNFVPINDQQESPTESVALKWPNDQLIYIDKNTNDPLNSYNYGTATCLVQTELNTDVNLSVGQEMVVNTSYDDSSNHSQLECPTVDKTLYTYQNDLNYSPTIKMENVPFLPEVEKMDETFPISSFPQMEVTIGSAKKSHICNNCGASFARAKALSSHVRLHLIGWPNKYECESCGEAFETEQIKSEHKENCLLNNTLLNVIPESPKNTEKIVDVKKNTKFLKVGKHSCPECQKKFTTKQKMFRHMWIHRKKTYSCEMCSLTFEIQTDLDKHRLSQHPRDSPYVCQECGKCFASRQGLWEHGRVHGTGTAGLFQCDTCSKTFASRQGYLIHNRTHTGERPYGCRFCMKAFRDGGTLRKHERIHTGERPHVCPICLHDFNQKVVLREHVRWVHVASKSENDKGLFECQLCNFGITDKEELCAHIVRHSDQMAAQAKSSARTQKIEVKPADKKMVRRKVNGVVKDENDLTEIENDQFSDLLTEKNQFECDMCGSNFSSQKELQSHVHIHI